MPTIVRGPGFAAAAKSGVADVVASPASLSPGAPATEVGYTGALAEPHADTLNERAATPTALSIFIFVMASTSCTPRDDECSRPPGPEIRRPW